MSAVLAAARAAWFAGISVLPARNDGSKFPRSYPIPDDCPHPDCVTRRNKAADEGRKAKGWAHYKHARMKSAELARELRDCEGMCFITGAISGNLMLLETDEPHIADLLRAEARRDGIGDLMDRLDNGYRERSPRGAHHWLFSLDTDGAMPGNTKLARRPKRPDEMRDPADKVQVLIETRGEGGLVVVAPSHGSTHPSGKPYVLEAGSYDTIPILTPAEWEMLAAAARRLDQMPTKAPRSEHKTSSARHRAHDPLVQLAEYDDDSETPMERFNRRTTWAEILERHGWTWLHHDGLRDHWSRPGKTPPGTSATTIEDGPLKVFSTSTVFDDDEPGYSKFHAYAVLEHGGDDSAAARTLRAYWTEQEKKSQTGVNA